MRIILLRLLLSGAFLAAPALAEEPRPAQQPLTRIELDEPGGKIHFIVKGELAAVLDGSGLHILHDITYGDVLTDDGGYAFHQALEASEKEVSDE